MSRLALALLTLVLAGCGASTYAQPRPEKLERAAEQTDPLLGSVSFSENPKHVLAIVTSPEVTSVALTEQAVGTKEPFGHTLSSTGNVARRFLIEAKGKAGVAALVAIVEVMDPNGLQVGTKDTFSGADTLAIDSKLEAEPCFGVEAGRKIAADGVPKR
jgi:hypothetical protein